MCKLVVFIALPFFFFGQIGKTDSVLTIHGGVDYYVGAQLNDFNQDKASIYVSHNHLGGSAINLALLEIAYQPRSNLRMQLSPGFGSYMNSNYVNERKNLRWIYEGYIGFRPTAKKSDWIDFGVFSSPYTYEFAKSWEQTIYTRSLAPEYVPYYLLGIRYKKKINPNLNATFFILNGWQHLELQRKIPSLGTQLEFTKGKNYVSWTTYQGNEKNHVQPDFGYRLFSEISWIYTASKFKLLGCGYTGMQLISDKPKFWGQLNFSGEYSISKNSSFNGRIEHFMDPNNIQVYRASKDGFVCTAVSLGFQYKVSDNFSIRLESKILRDNLNTGYFYSNNQELQILPLGFLGIQTRF